MVTATSRKAGFEWFGDKILERAELAERQGLAEIGKSIAISSKQYSPVKTGRLRRSIHLNKPSYEGINDHHFATNTDLARRIRPMPYESYKSGYRSLVGSWIFYAYINEVTRNRRFVWAGVNAQRGRPAEVLMIKRFKANGFK